MSTRDADEDDGARKAGRPVGTAPRAWLLCESEHALHCVCERFLHVQPEDLENSVEEEVCLEAGFCRSHLFSPGVTHCKSKTM